MLSLFKKDIFGNPHLIKKWVIRIVGIVSYRRFRGINNLIITGTENIKKLPEKMFYSYLITKPILPMHQPLFM